MPAANLLSAPSRWGGLIERYREFLPVSDATPVVTLNEGNTPLIACERLSRRVGRNVRVWVKYEGLNPTGSFKDRGMTMAVSKAAEEGSRAVMCASTGNTSASAAAYAARAGMRCAVLIPAGKNVALGKLAQAMIAGAQVIRIDGNFDQALEMVREITAKHPITLVNSLNPYRIEGQKTGAFEICEQLGGRAPRIHCIPVGNAGNITAYWKGYTEFKLRGRIDSTPVMWGFQAEGSAPIVRGRKVEHPETIATAIRIGNPASWKQAEAARDESGGLIDMVSDAEITEASKFLATQEGVFCEPASAASVAGLIKKADAGLLRPFLEEHGTIDVACILTGHGLKDPDFAIHNAGEAIQIPATMQAVLDLLAL
ncbi:threonine synthase [Candidatus Poribacteria bacterium]|nr:threonine synthase [Candidatus Poribacteria bacterium]